MNNQIVYLLWFKLSKFWRFQEKEEKSCVTYRIWKNSYLERESQEKCDPVLDQ